MRNINIGLIGYGTVGQGIYKILYNNSKLYKMMGLNINIPKICVNNVSKKRDFIQYSKCEQPIVTNNYNDLIEDKNIDIIVEVIGGIDKPYDIFNKTLKNNKYFVTANKALLASQLHTINVELMIYKKLIGIEGSVCGGIPIIETLQNQYLSDEILELKGIINGTCNFILTKMIKEHKNYEDVLKEAQKKGFAELDPSADVKGYDARSKIKILSYLAHGVYIKEEDIFTLGINNITQDDLLYATYTKRIIKHMAIFKKHENKITAYVLPTLVRNNNIFSNVNNEENIVEITSKYNNKSILIGKGAGMEPTALSVVKDIVNISQNIPNKISSNLTDVIDIPQYRSDFESNFMVRINIKKENIYNIIDTINIIEHEFKINKTIVSRLPHLKNENFDTLGYITTQTNINNILNFIDTIKELEFYEDSHIFNYH